MGYPERAEVREVRPILTPEPTSQASSVSQAAHELPDDLRHRLEEQHVRVPQDLAELTAAEVEDLGRGLTWGSIARLRALHRGSQPRDQRDQ